jgi:hypothetical protein
MGLLDVAIAGLLVAISMFATIRYPTDVSAQLGGNDTCEPGAGR